MARAWFCVRTQPKREHVAAGHLRQLPELEVVLPRIRFRRVGIKGAVWTTEALFPGYLFARFDWTLQLRQVHHSPGVAAVVHFGQRWPTVPDGVIEELQRGLGEGDVRVIPDPLRPGEAAEVAVGVLRGLEGVVRRVLPARQRVEILLEFLGRQVGVEIPLEQVRPIQDIRVRWEELDKSRD